MRRLRCDNATDSDKKTETPCGTCPPCRERVAARARYAADPETARAKNKAKRDRNPESHRSYNKKWGVLGEKTPQRCAKRRFYQMKSKYGLTKDQFEALLVEQNGCCAWCRKPFGPGKDRPAVDHDHTLPKGPGAVRGLLHVRCNVRIGHYEAVRNDKDRADAYLDRKK